MSNPMHIVETALLLLAGYLVGCILGYGAHRILHAARGTRQPNPAIAPIALPVSAAVPAPKRTMTSAARLAAAASSEPMPLPPTTTRQPVAKPASKPRSKARPKRQPADPRPAALGAPRDGRADNLKQIKGIGPKIEASLNGLGVYHFDQIAAWTKANVSWVDGQLAFKGRIGRERWVEQATELTKLPISN